MLKNPPARPTYAHDEIRRGSVLERRPEHGHRTRPVKRLADQRQCARVQGSPPPLRIPSAVRTAAPSAASAPRPVPFRGSAAVRADRRTARAAQRAAQHAAANAGMQPCLQRRAQRITFTLRPLPPPRRPSDAQAIALEARVPRTPCATRRVVAARAVWGQAAKRRAPNEHSGRHRRCGARGTAPSEAGSARRAPRRSV